MHESEQLRLNSHDAVIKDSGDLLPFTRNWCLNGTSALDSGVTTVTAGTRHLFQSIDQSDAGGERARRPR